MNFFKRMKNEISHAVLPSTNTIVAEIHNSFDVAADEALREAKLIIAQSGDEEQKKLADCLQKAGFTMTTLVRKDLKERSNRASANHRADCINKYALKYPQYKFIFRDQVEAICNKYGLLCVPVQNYKGDVPVKNIKEIANFSVQNEDIYYRRSFHGGFAEGTENLLEGHHIPMKEYEAIKQLEDARPPEYRNIGDRRNTKMPLYICAPVKDISISDARQLKKGSVFLQSVPDPIVLHFVKDGFLIVSKWGLEGEDKQLTNEKMN